LPFCQKHNIGVVSYSPMQSGLLTGKMTRERIEALPASDWRRGGRGFQEPMLTRAFALVERLREIGARHGRSPGEVAVAWVLHQPAITAAIVGARRPQQIEEIVGAGEFRLTSREMEELGIEVRQ
jgi:aryl-alcohol dehydrogenase-like predicted oxidoreductase